MTALRRTSVSLWNHNADEWAAALTYYAILALVPAVLVTVSLIGIAGPAATQDLISQATAMAPADARAVTERTLRGMADQRTAAWLLAVTGTAGALWSACGYLAVFRRSLHTMYGVGDPRPFWRTVPGTALTAAALLTLLVAGTILLMLTGEAARAIGSALGLDHTALTAWNTRKWPMLLCVAVVLVLLLFHTGPPPTRRARHIAPGGVLALVLWLAASAGFARYVSWAGTYNRLYGSLAGSIVFLVWLWVSNLTLLAGAQFNAELAKLRPRPARERTTAPAPPP
ncbi:YihY/virulence factor BrkB family protein [Streptomyces polyrhachis]|uniref:YihY/virulence factor BrkB family protein n=1 Tax=Streptomyces polyrhachis TaxID=1282885 RepID=A0ABW2GFP9_9ACTN